MNPFFGLKKLVIFINGFPYHILSLQFICTLAPDKVKGDGMEQLE